MHARKVAIWCHVSDGGSLCMQGRLLYGVTCRMVDHYACKGGCYMVSRVGWWITMHAREAAIWCHVSDVWLAVPYSKSRPTEVLNNLSGGNSVSDV